MLPHIAARAFNTPLLVDPRKCEAILLGIGGRIIGGEIELTNGIGAVDHVAFGGNRPSMGFIGDRLGRAYDRHGILPFAVVDGVAVIAVEGTLIAKGSFVGSSSGETSYEGLRVQVARAARSDQVRAAVLEVDSFGGEVSGAFETAEAIAQLSVAKPTLAILTDNALSAGYLLASAARQIIMPRFGRAGSIGVVSMHVDFSKQLEKAGVRVTLIAAGARKTAGNPFEPIPDDLRDRIQGEVEGARKVFADTVGRHRGQRLTAERAMATEADSYIAADSVRLGLVDAVGDPQEAFAAFVAAVKRS